jgi:hypothetical protein
MKVIGCSKGHSEDDGNEYEESGAVLSENSAIYRNCSIPEANNSSTEDRSPAQASGGACAYPSQRGF